MRTFLKVCFLTVCVGTLLSATVAQSADEKEYKPKAVSKTFFEGALDGLKGKKTVIKEFVLPPGFRGGAHYHPAHVFVYVVDGELSIDIPGQPTQTFKAGELYREKVGQVMVGGNASTTSPTKIVVFQIGDADKPMMIKATETTASKAK